jgi:hypothetical protein
VIARLIRVATLVAIVTSSTRALAEPSVTLEWRATPGSDCPSGAEVTSEVDRILEGSAGSRRQISAQAVVTRTASGGHRVKLATSGADTAGRRTFEAASCREIAAACALILAMTVNPQLSSNAASGVARAESARPDEPAAPPDSASTNAPVPAVQRAPEAPRADDGYSRALPPASSSPKRFGASASFAGDVGSLPSVAAGAELALAFAADRLRLELAGRMWAPSRTTGATSAGATFDLFLVGVRGGYALVKARSVKVGPALGLEVAHMRAGGFGGTTAFSPDATTLGASMGLLSTWSPFAELPSFAFRFLVEAAVPFSRPRFVVREPPPAPPTDVHSAAPVVGRAGVGAELLFF